MPLGRPRWHLVVWRMLLTIVAVSSLMVSAATAFLWVRGYWRSDVIVYNSSLIADGPGGERLISRYFSAVSSGARFVVRTYTHQLGPIDGGERQRGSLRVDSQQPQGWTYFVAPAPYGFLVPKAPPFEVLGLHVSFQREREVGLKALIPSGPNGKARAGGLYLTVPHWMVVLIGLMAPTWWWFVRRRRLLRLHRLNHGLCVTCGYDLRASPQGGRCPECGVIPAVPKTAA